MNTYRVTRHQGSTATSSTTGTLLYKTPEESVAFRVYDMLRPLSGTTLAVWAPDGTLVALKSGPHRQQSA
jgi:hypothetical protein